MLKTKPFTYLTGAIDNQLTLSEVAESKVVSVNVKFSDVLTQDRFYINRLDQFGNVLESYGLDLYDLDATATQFTWVPPERSMKLRPKDIVQVAFVNNDARTLSVPESNITYDVE